MKHLCLFTINDTQKKVGIRAWDVCGVGEVDRLSTRVTFLSYHAPEVAQSTIEVVGSFEETIEKIEACKA